MFTTCNVSAFQTDACGGILMISVEKQALASQPARGGARLLFLNQSRTWVAVEALPTKSGWMLGFLAMLLSRAFHLLQHSFSLGICLWPKVCVDCSIVCFWQLVCKSHVPSEFESTEIHRVCTKQPILKFLNTQCSACFTDANPSRDTCHS